MSRADPIPDPPSADTAAVVLAGGRARRFGSDKLTASVAGRALLERAIAQIPASWSLVVVGPERDLSRSHITTSEQPPGGGPAAALVAGAQAARRTGATTMVTLPGDAPAGGAAAVALVRALHVGRGSPAGSGTGATCTQPEVSHDVTAVVAVDGYQHEQPLHVALTGIAFDRLAAVGQAADRSARSLLRCYGDYRPVLLGPHLLVDLDTPEQAAAWAAD